MAKSGKIKIVIGINDFSIGGAQKFIAESLNFFNRDRFDFYLISLFQFKDRKNLYNLLPRHVKVYKLNFRGFKDIKQWLYLIKVLKKIKPDIVLSNLFFSNTVFRILKLLFGYKVIIVEHSTYIKKSHFKILVDKILSYITHRIIAVSKTVAKFTAHQEKISKEKFLVIHNSVNYQEIKQIKEKYNKSQLKRELGFKGNNKIIINVGRLAGLKNHKLLIDAFNEFSKTKDNYKLIILGGGSLKDGLNRQIKRLNLNNKAFLLGEKRKEDVYRHYAISDFFVLTSKREGFAIVGIEAMTFGLPVISTKVAGADEYIKDYFNGFLVKDDIKDICEHMLLLSNLDNKQLSFYKKNSINTAKRFDIRKNVKKYEELFSSCLHKGRIKKLKKI